MEAQLHHHLGTSLFADRACLTKFNGTEVIPTTSLNQYFADRQYAAQQRHSELHVARPRW